jgi:nucleotide-binding universal stress UspA family protein
MWYVHMGLYERILVPTDGSDAGRDAVRHAAALAATHDATLVGVYVVNAAGYAALPTETNWEGLDQVLRADGEAALETVREIAAERGVANETHLLEGTPSREIVEFAERADCDLIVMSTHGRGGIDRLLLGSVAEKVIRAANVPVTTIRVGCEDVPGCEPEPDYANATDETTTAGVEAESNEAGASAETDA